MGRTPDVKTNIKPDVTSGVSFLWKYELEGRLLVADERRTGNTEMLFMIGEMHSQCARIPIMERKLDEQEDKLHACQNRTKR